MKSQLRKLGFYAAYAWRFIALQQPVPLIYGIALTDRCNLNCRGCRVANTGRPDMTWPQLQQTMQSAWQRGFREVYFSGGEPMLWRDGSHALADVVKEARRIGFYHIHIYTNGTLGLDIDADLVWVSMDGLPETFQTRRGGCFHLVEQSIRAAQNVKIALIYTIDSATAGGIESFLRWVQSSRLPVIGVMFYFHTPYYGKDELFLDTTERAKIISQLLRYRIAGLPVINSRAGLLMLASEQWPRRLPVAYVADVDGEYICCRAGDETCVDCGYAACTEIVAAQRLRPSALLAMARYW